MSNRRTAKARADQTRKSIDRHRGFIAEWRRMQRDASPELSDELQLDIRDTEAWINTLIGSSPGTFDYDASARAKGGSHGYARLPVARDSEDARRALQRGSEGDEG